jgi:hypothetical protein
MEWKRRENWTTTRLAGEEKVWVFRKRRKEEEMGEVKEGSGWDVPNLTSAHRYDRRC